MHICPKTLGDHGCAECLRNRTYDKRIWCARMDLESRCHAENSFLTLTYSDDCLPAGGTLVPRDVELWRKRFRQEFGPFRYFFVGEYGDDSNRPHYHAALFGVGPQFEDMVRETWQMGHVMLAELNIQTIRYITGYVTKKMTSKYDERLDGRHPEFRSMSKGLGRGYVGEIVDTLDEQSAHVSVPNSLFLSGTKAPLGKYLRKKIREGMYNEKTPVEYLREIYPNEETVQRVFKNFFANPSSFKTLTAFINTHKFSHDSLLKFNNLHEKYLSSSLTNKMTFKEYLDQQRKQQNRNMEATFKLKQKGTL